MHNLQHNVWSYPARTTTVRCASCCQKGWVCILTYFTRRAWKSVWFPGISGSFPIKIIRLVFFCPLKKSVCLPIRTHSEYLYYRCVKHKEQLSWRCLTSEEQRSDSGIAKRLNGQPATLLRQKRPNRGCCLEEAEGLTGREHCNL